MVKNLIASTVLATSLTAAVASQVQADEPIKVGMLLPFKGVYASLATNFENGWNVAFEEFGGEVNGHKVVVVKGDTEASPNVAIQRASRLIQSDDVDLLAGVVSGGVGVAMGKFATQRKFPLVLGFAIPDVITGENCSPYVARTSFSASAYTRTLGTYFASRFDTASTLGPDYATGHAMLGGFADGFKGAGKDIVEMHYTAFKKTKDWAPVFSKIKEDNAGMLFSFYAGGEAIQVVKQYHDFGMKDATGPLFGDMFLYDRKLWDAMGDAVDGGVFGVFAYPAVDSAANKAFNEAYQKAHGELPDFNAVLGYENGKAIFLALQKLGGNVPDGAEFIKALQSVEFASPRGDFRLSSANNAQIDKVYLVEISKQDGDFVGEVVETLPGEADPGGCNM